MRTTRTLRAARQAHRWIGAVLALFLLVISLSGTALIWKNNYVRLIFPQADQTFDTPAVIRLALAAEDAFGTDDILTTRFDRGTNLTRLSLRDGRAAYLAADGSVLDVWSANDRPEDWLLDLHHRFLSGTLGLYVVGGVGIATLGLIVLGMVAFWTARRGWRQGLRLHGTARAQMQAAHRNFGIVVGLPLGVVILSGVVLTFPATARAVFLWSVDQDTYGEVFAQGVDDLEGSPEATWPRAINRAIDVFPNAQITGLSWPIDGNERVIHLRDAPEWNADGNSSVQITVPDGYMDLRIEAAELPGGERAYNFMTPLHTSRFGGWVYDVVQTIFGLGLAWLALLGLASFVRKPKG